MISGSNERLQQELEYTLLMSDCHSWWISNLAVWSILYVSVAFFLSLKPNFIAYSSSKVYSRPDCIFDIHQLWQSGFCRVYSNSCCSCSFEPGIIKIGQLSHKMYSNNVLNFQESTTILNACTKSLEIYWIHHVSTQFNCQKHFYFKLFSLVKILFQTIQFNVSIYFFVYSQLNIKKVLFRVIQFSISTNYTSI